MFSVKINRMANCCMQLEQESRRLDQLGMELEDVIQRLSSLSSLDEQILALKKLRSQMEEEDFSLRQMMRALDKITMNYMNYENRIYENAEQSVMSYVYRGVGITDLSGISEMISDVEFIL